MKTLISPQKQAWKPGGGGGGGVKIVLGSVSDRDAQHLPSTRNATRVKKIGGGRNYTFCPILMKNRVSKYDIFLIFAKI